MALDYFALNEVSFVSGVLKASALALLCCFVYQFVNPGKPYNYPPGPTGLPFLGSVLSLILTKKHQHEVVAEWTKKYGNIICIKLLNTRLVILNDVKLIKEVFSGHQVLGKPPVPINKEVTERQSAGVAFSSGDICQEHRRFFLSMFKKPANGGIRYEKIIEDQMIRVLSEFEKRKGQPFEPNQLMYASMGNIIMKIMTGVTYEYDDSKLLDIVMCSKQIFDQLGPGAFLRTQPMLATIPSPSKRLLTESWNGLLDSIRESVESHKSATEPQEADFINKYFAKMSGKEGNTSFDEVHLLESCFEMVLGGIETSATTLEWILYTLASHPEAQRRIRQEINEVIGKDRFSQYSDHTNMPQTMAVIAECMRFRPIVPFPYPHMTVEDFKIGQYDIPQGTHITFASWNLSRSPELWENTEEFRPERFLTEDGTFDKKLEPIFFGAGRRTCPEEVLARAEIFLFITNIVKCFDLRMAEGSAKHPRCVVGLTIRPEPYRIHAEKIA